MVGYENSPCKIMWFHMACLCINKASKGNGIALVVTLIILNNELNN